MGFRHAFEADAGIGAGGGGSEPLPAGIVIGIFHESGGDAAAFDRLRDHGVQDVQHSVMDAVLDMGGVPFDRGVHDPLFRVMPYLQFLHRHKGT